MLGARSDTVDAGIEEFFEVGSLQHLAAVSACRHDRSLQAAKTCGFHIFDRSLVGLNRLLLEKPKEDFVLLIGQCGDLRGW